MKRNLRAQADYKSVLLRNQLTSLVLFEAITTTKTKGKELLPFANHFFNKIKTNDLSAKRLAHQTLLDKNAISKVFEELLPRYKSEETTYVRSYRVMPRRGDSAEQLMISFIRPLKIEEPKAKKTAEEKAAKPEAKKTTKAKTK